MREGAILALPPPPPAARSHPALQAAGAAPADCSQGVEETAQLLQGLADRELLGATFAVHYKDCGFTYVQASRPMQCWRPLSVPGVPAGTAACSSATMHSLHAQAVAVMTNLHACHPLQAFGYSVPELKVPMAPEVAVPIRDPQACHGLLPCGAGWTRDCLGTSVRLHWKMC